VETGVLKRGRGWRRGFVPKSMSEADARVVLVNASSPAVPAAHRRVLDVPVPILR
jgi:hypothetical protein